MSTDELSFPPKFGEYLAWEYRRGGFLIPAMIRFVMIRMGVWFYGVSRLPRRQRDDDENGGEAG